MDSLIVLRKPLRKSLLAPTFIIPKKSKKALTKVVPFPPDPHSEESGERPISFVKLYKELCLENSRRANAHVLVRSPASTDTSDTSDTSLVTQYRGRVLNAPEPPVTAKAELLLELDYGIISTGSEFS